MKNTCQTAMQQIHGTSLPPPHMALVDQWRRQRPWLAMGLAGIGSTLLGPVGFASGLIPWAIQGAASTDSARIEGPEDHPLRHRIMRILVDRPGLGYRELQTVLGAANGTLRHHLDVLITRGTVTVVPVNGRTCHYAGHPSQCIELRGMMTSDDVRAAEMLPHGLSLLQRLVVEALDAEKPPHTQAELSRLLGRSRASVHSAVKVLRRRGILHASKLCLAPHLEQKGANGENRALDYEWSDPRVPR